VIFGSLLLIFAAIALAVLGVMQGSNPLLVGSIGASLLAAVALIVGARQAAAPAGDALAAAPAGTGAPVADDLEVAGVAGPGPGRRGGRTDTPGPRRPGAGTVYGHEPAVGAVALADPLVDTMITGTPVVPPERPGPPYGVPAQPEPAGPQRSATAAEEPPAVAGDTVPDRATGPDDARPDDAGPDEATGSEPLAGEAPASRPDRTDILAGTPLAGDPPADAGPVADDPGVLWDEPDEQVLDDPSDRARVARLTVDVRVIDGRPRYHVAGCVHLLGADHEPIPVNEAIELGFTPCALCEPDSRLLADARRV